MHEAQTHASRPIECVGVSSMLSPLLRVERGGGPLISDAFLDGRAELCLGLSGLICFLFSAGACVALRSGGAARRISAGCLTRASSVLGPAVVGFSISNLSLVSLGRVTLDFVSPNGWGYVRVNLADVLLAFVHLLPSCRSPVMGNQCSLL